MAISAAIAKWWFYIPSLVSLAEILHPAKEVTGWEYSRPLYCCRRWERFSLVQGRHALRQEVWRAGLLIILSSL